MDELVLWYPTYPCQSKLLKVTSVPDSSVCNDQLFLIASLLIGSMKLSHSRALSHSLNYDKSTYECSLLLQFGVSQVQVVIQWFWVLDLETSKVWVGDQLVGWDHLVCPDGNHLTFLVDQWDNDWQTVQLCEVLLLYLEILSVQLDHVVDVLACLD